MGGENNNIGWFWGVAVGIAILGLFTDFIPLWVWKIIWIFWFIWLWNSIKKYFSEIKQILKDIRDKDNEENPPSTSPDAPEHFLV